MPTTIYLLRHGKTHNPNDIIKGHLPGFPLGREGERQIEKAGRRLSRKKIAAIYTSPLLRTRQSAKIIHKYFPSVKFKILEDLTERKSLLQGRPISYARGRSYAFYRKYHEPEEKVFARMQRAVRKIIKGNPKGEVVVFSHGWPITALVYSLEGKKVKMPMRSFPYQKILALKLDKNLKLLAKPKLLGFS